MPINVSHNKSIKKIQYKIRCFVFSKVMTFEKPFKLILMFYNAFVMYMT